MNAEKAPDAKAARKWIIALIAFDDPDMIPQVIKECIADDDDERVAAFLRGGELLDVIIESDEDAVESYRRQVERKCLR